MMASAFDDLPRVSLRAVHARDEDFLRLLATPEVSGTWDSFDEPSAQLLSANDFGGTTSIVESPDSQRLGSVSCIQIPYGPNVKSLAWSIGVTILPEFRGRRVGASAQRTLALKLFEESEANRVQADTDPHNVAEQRSLVRAGFTREGIARGAQWRKGGWHDRIVFSLLRSDVDDRDVDPTPMILPAGPERHGAF
jgi:RimJ/RimL family protein N-acetyltransferase